MQKKIISFLSEMVVVILLLSVAMLIRVKLASLNFWQDEPYTVAAVSGILEHGVPQLPSGALYTRALPYSYIVAFMVAFFGRFEIVFRLVSIALGIGSIVFLYYFFKSISTRLVAIVIASILIFSPWHITYSVFARPYMMQIVLYFLILWSYYRFFQTKRNRFLVINIPLLFFAGLLSQSTVLFIPVIAYVLLFSILRKKKNILSVSTLILVGALTIIPGLLVPGAYLSSSAASYSDLSPTSLVYVKTLIMPNVYFWKTLISFFPIGSFLFFVSSAYFWFKNKHFFIFPLFVITSFLFLSFVNPFGNLQPRYLSIFMLPYFVSVFYFLYVFLKKKNALYFVLCSLVVSDMFLFPHMLDISYGKELKKTMLISHSWTEFPDIKSQTEYVNSKYKKGDVVISLQPKGHTEVYARFKTNYLLRTESFESEGRLVKGVFRDDYFGIPIIISMQNLEDTVKNHNNQRIWIISSKSQLPTMRHIDKKTRDWIIQNTRLVYHGKDKYSAVYRISTQASY